MRWGRRLWRDSQDWQPWFAWRPVRAMEPCCGDSPRRETWVWFEWIERRCRGLIVGIGASYTYRIPRGRSF